MIHKAVLELGARQSQPRGSFAEVEGREGGILIFRAISF
jgi:hypothetical protein